MMAARQRNQPLQDRGLGVEREGNDMTRTLRVALATGGLVVVAVGASLFALRTGPTQLRENYTISPRSDVAVIQVWSGSPSPERVTTALYGDDRLVVESWNAYDTARRSVARREHQIPHDDTRELVDIAIDGGLIGLSWDDLRQRVVEETGAEPITLQHSGALRIRYRLDAMGVSGEPVDFTFECRCAPGVLFFHHPEVPEVASLNSLMAKITEYTRGLR